MFFRIWGCGFRKESAKAAPCREPGFWKKKWKANRSAIFPASPEQEAEAGAAIMRAQPDWPAPIVTTIEAQAPWYPAEDYHQDYWAGEGQRNPYCLAVIPPKLAKLSKKFAARLRG